VRILDVGWRARAGLAAVGLLAGVAGLAGAVPAQAATTATVTAQSATTAPATPPHIMTIMMENTDYSQFVGSPAMPYLNEIAHEYADFTDAWGWTYPSLPNYLELLSGSDDGVGTTDTTAGNDCDITQKGCNNFTNPTLVDQLEKAGISWNAYYQGDPAGCYQGDGSGNYPYWHNAFRYFADFAEQCSHLDDYSDLLSNLNSANAADFQWLVPDLVGSGGDNGTMSSGDSWLAGELPKIMDTSWYRDGGQIVLLYDTGYEDVGGVGQSTGKAGGGQIPMVVISPHTKHMGVVTTPVNTAGVLRSIEQAYGLSYLGNAANASNGSLGTALLSGRPHSNGAGTPGPVSVGDAVTISNGTPDYVSTVRGSISINGVARQAGGASLPVIEAGQNRQGQGVIDVPGQPTQVVPGTSDLESVSCSAAGQCYAVGLAAPDTDEAVLVSITADRVASVTALPAFIGLYGIDCPAAGTCYAVGYDNKDDADAVTTITNGTASAPAEVKGGGEWLNAISCPSATECYATGLVNYYASIVPIAKGVPGTAVTIPGAWYANGIDCWSVGNCAVAGENSKEQGVIGTLVDGKAGKTTVVTGTEYLYGVACGSASACVATGAGVPGASGYSSGVVVNLAGGKATAVTTVRDSNGYGQVISDGNGYVAVGAAYKA
jgi:phosphatidylinositol-3-phosphatase